MSRAFVKEEAGERWTPPAQAREYRIVIDGEVVRLDRGQDGFDEHRHVVVDDEDLDGAALARGHSDERLSAAADPRVIEMSAHPVGGRLTCRPVGPRPEVVVHRVRNE